MVLLLGKEVGSTGYGLMGRFSSSEANEPF